VGAIGLAAVQANAQSRELLDQVSVTPLPGEPTCYAGTAGVDATIFLRNDIHRIDCSIFSGQAPCLARREFPGDGANGRPISLEGVIILRPSVSGDGVSVWFNGFGFNVCGMQTASERNEGCFGRDLIGIDVHSTAVSPFGSPVAVSALDSQFQPSNQIFLGDAATFALLEQYTVQTADTGGAFLQVESMDFTVDGRFLIVDAFNPVLGWGIYAVSRTTGLTTTLVQPVAGLALRNPALAQTSDDFMAFDAQDVMTGATTVFAANLLTGALSEIASSATLGYPSYTGNDAAIVFTDGDASTESQVSLDVQPLGSDRMAPQGPRARWLTDGGVGVIYRRGTFDGTLAHGAACSHGFPLGVDSPTIDHTELAGENETVPLKLTNQGTGSVDYTVAADQPWLTVQPESGSLGAGAEQVIDLLFDTQGLDPGDYESGVTITDLSAPSAPLVVAVRLTVPEASAAWAALAAAAVLARRRRDSNPHASRRPR
jgi:hypothetical protein